MTKIIAYTGGAFGNFLVYLLNYMAGNARQTVEKTVYDGMEFEQNFFGESLSIENCDMYINIHKNSYLKYLVTNVNRISGVNLILEDLHVNTFKKIQTHSSLKFFEKSLIEISGKTSGDVEPKFLREWFRLCFFSNNCKAIDDYIGERPDNCFMIDFEMFFNKDRIKKCANDILNFYSVKIVNHNVDELIDEFHQKHYYKNHVDTELLTTAIDSGQCIDLTLNLIEQAWLDNWLSEKYGISPMLNNQYPSDTHELIDLYDLPVDKL